MDEKKSKTVIEMLNDNLKNVLQELKILSSPIKHKAEKWLFEKKLFDDNSTKKDIYLLVDGIKDTNAISQELGLTPQHVNRMLNELNDLGVIDIELVGRTKIAEKNIEKVVALCYGDQCGGLDNE